MSQDFTPSQILKSLSDATAEVVEKAASSLVSVISEKHGHRGSGVIWSSDGYIVTCSHVVSKSKTVTIGLEDGRKLEANVVGQDSYSDVALLKIEDGGTFEPIEQGDSESIKVGQFALAVAKFTGRHPSATSGMITNVGLSFQGWRGMTMDNLIVTDAPLNPGYSGGPLLDASGKMIGMNAAYAWSRGLSIPVSTIKRVTDGLVREGKVQRAYLGIKSSTIMLPQEIATQEEVNQEEGVMVFWVEKDSPAKKAGLALGDIIVKFDEKPVTNVYDLPKLLTEEVIGKKTKLEVLRGEKPINLTITPIAA
ncbi:MAG: trypsin-like peptidase domain-containing protein [Candidatus Freyarchaeum deiterrae]